MCGRCCGWPTARYGSSVLTLPELQHLLERFTFKDWELHLYQSRWEGIWLCVTADLDNSYSPGDPVTVKIRSAVPPMPHGRAFYEWLVWRLTRVAIHEVLEWA